MILMAEIGRNIISSSGKKKVMLQAEVFFVFEGVPAPTPSKFLGAEAATR